MWILYVLQILEYEVGAHEEREWMYIEQANRIYTYKQKWQESLENAIYTRNTG